MLDLIERADNVIWDKTMGKEFQNMDVLSESGSTLTPEAASSLEAISEVASCCGKMLAEVVIPITTMMVYDLPCHRSMSDLIDAIHEYGFADTYDLVYMPARRTKSSDKNGRVGNLGYAFVNFKTSEYAEEFQRVFRDVSMNSKKLASAKPSTCQGYEANMAVFNSRTQLPGALVQRR